MEPDPLASGPRRVEAYLDQILAPLNHRLSPFHHDELRRELREHLLARVDAHREQGYTDDEAMAEALRQFGGAEDFLRQWQREWSRASRRLTLRDVYEAGRSALRPALTGIIGANLLYLVLQEGIWHLPHSHIIAMINRHPEVFGLSLGGFAFVLLPVFVGARYGRRTPARAGVGMLAALTAEILVTSLLYGIVALNLPDWADRGITNMLFNFLLATLIGWIPVAGGAAAITGWRARQSLARYLA